ncbi:MAG: GNAT family N-acetyltransferase [Chloroflexota bacterium]
MVSGQSARNERSDSRRAGARVDRAAPSVATSRDEPREHGRDVQEENTIVAQRGAVPNVTIRQLRQEDLASADRVFRLAFGTFLGLPDPEQFGADFAQIASRWTADPTRVFAAEADGRLVGTSVASNWGSVGFLGPITVMPEFWDEGVGTFLMAPVMQRFTAWGNRHLGLLTFPHSPKHIHLYEKFGFFPRFLTPILGREVGPHTSAATGWSAYSTLAESERAQAIAACRAVADAVYDGLDVTCEIEAVQGQGLGDTVLLHAGSQVTGFAVCHCGEGTEAGKDVCYVKFGAVQPGAAAGPRFTRLLSACEALAGSRGMTRLSAGVNLGCEEAYRHMRKSGFRTDFIGVALQQPNEAGYHRPDRYVLSDWR